uniref:Uncharacterized protein n=1 Tax=Sphaerodactylus townsendi TaxID=933632 RepID=A0ACB8EXS8_9SAUR
MGSFQKHLRKGAQLGLFWAGMQRSFFLPWIKIRSFPKQGHHSHTGNLGPERKTWLRLTPKAPGGCLGWGRPKSIPVVSAWQCREGWMHLRASISDCLKAQLAFRPKGLHHQLVSLLPAFQIGHT